MLPGHKTLPLSWAQHCGFGELRRLGTHLVIHLWEYNLVWLLIVHIYLRLLDHTLCLLTLFLHWRLLHYFFIKYVLFLDVKVLNVAIPIQVFPISIGVLVVISLRSNWLFLLVSRLIPLHLLQFNLLWKLLKFFVFQFLLRLRELHFKWALCLLMQSLDFFSLILIVLQNLLVLLQWA
jgi:hypothetical protein